MNGLRGLEADPPAYGRGVPNVAVLTTVVALDYLRLRFGDATWVEPTPKLDGLLAKVADRPAYASTEPCI